MLVCKFYIFTFHGIQFFYGVSLRVFLSTHLDKLFDWKLNLNSSSETVSLLISALFPLSIKQTIVDDFAYEKIVKKPNDAKESRF